jgi:DNA-binding MarR family transcriptional regulator/GNAT superfamily N-acetyltransferase
MTVQDKRVNTVRAFSRSYTELIGVLDEGLLRTPYSLTEARVIFELAQRDVAEVADLRRGLGLDAGYLSRILTRFEVHGLIARERSAVDGRRQVIRLTDAGRGVFRMLDARSTEQVRELLARLTEEDQRRLVSAMAVIQEVVEQAPRKDAYLLRPLRPGDIGWVVHRHGVRYAEEYGWDDSFEALVARILADYVDNRDPRCENAWIAEVDGEAVGCVFCVRGGRAGSGGGPAEQTAQLRLLLVEPRARGMGIGGRLVEECVRFARRAGYREITLWTNDVLAAARRIYQRAGFTLVDERPHHSFGHELVGQHWSLTLK